MFLCLGAACAGGKSQPPPRIGGEAEAAPPPARQQLVSCLDGLESRAQPDVASCIAELHGKPHCAAAWKAAGAPITRSALAEIGRACSEEYCPDLARPKPRICAEGAVPDAADVTPNLPLRIAELEAAVLAQEGGLDRDPALLGRVIATLVMMAPFYETSVEVELPKAEPNQPVAPLVIALGRSGDAQLNGKAVTDQEIASLCKKALETDPDASVLLQADENVTYERVVHVMDIVRTAGISRIALATSAAAN